jgi:hypothetical protein
LLLEKVQATPAVLLAVVISAQHLWSRVVLVQVPLVELIPVTVAVTVEILAVPLATTVVVALVAIVALVGVVQRVLEPVGVAPVVVVVVEPVSTAAVLMPVVVVAV